MSYKGNNPFSYLESANEAETIPDYVSYKLKNSSVNEFYTLLQKLIEENEEVKFYNILHVTQYPIISKTIVVQVWSVKKQIILMDDF